MEAKSWIFSGHVHVHTSLTSSDNVANYGSPTSKFIFAVLLDCAISSQNMLIFCPQRVVQLFKMSTFAAVSSCILLLVTLDEEASVNLGEFAPKEKCFRLQLAKLVFIFHFVVCSKVLLAENKHELETQDSPVQQDLVATFATGTAMCKSRQHLWSLQQSGPSSQRHGFSRRGI